PRAGAAARGLSATSGLHPRRVSAGDGPSVFRLLGLSAHRLLRAVWKLRHATGFDVLDRLPAPALYRRHFGLGAIPLSRRRTRPGSLRPHASLRAQRSAPMLPPGLDES